MGFALAAELLFPPRCLFCGELKLFRGGCPECAETAGRHRLPEGLRLNFEVQNRCAECLRATVSSFLYAEEVSEAVARYKFRRDYAMSREMAKIMAGDIRGLLGDDCCDLVLAVPTKKISRNRHAELLAKRVAGELSRRCAARLLMKARETRPQHELSAEERRSNLLGAFAVRDPSEVRGKRILLCDDVMTSGNTLNECARTLLAAGAKWVVAAAFAAAGIREEPRATAPAPGKDAR